MKTASIPDTIDLRRKFLKKELQRFRGKAFVCPALSFAKVFVTGSSINETVHHASKSKKSTCAALFLDKAIKTAKYHKEDKPKKGVQSKRFEFLNLIILLANVKDVGKVKITIGTVKSGKHVHYCITAIE